MQIRDLVLVDGVRTPMAEFNGSFADLSAIELGARAAKALFERTGVTVIPPGCGACIGCGPGVSERPDQVTVSAINRNYKGRSGPGRLYLASPLTVAASAVRGAIAGYAPGMFRS